MVRLDYLLAVRQHLTCFFQGHPCTEHRWNSGPMAEDPDFRILRFGQGQRTVLWTYCSIGASLTIQDLEPLEFLILSPVADERIVELLTMIAHYHRSDRLNLFHVLPIGQPWLDGSACDSFFVSLPYPFGPVLERMNLSGFHGRFLWLLPITTAEKQFAKQHGPEALEEKFEDAELEYWDSSRKSVI